MPEVAHGEMAEQRALLTETEREIVSGEREVKDNYRYSVESRIRTRLRGPLMKDVRTLREHFPEAFEELQSVVCEDDTDG